MKKKTSIRRSIFVFIYAFVFGLGIAFFVPSFIQQQRVVKQEFLERGKALTRNMAINCQKVLDSRDRDALFTLADSLMREIDILWILIYDAQGQIVAENGTVDFEHVTKELGRILVGDKITVNRIRMPDGRWAYDHAALVRKVGGDTKAMVNKELSLLEGYGEAGGGEEELRTEETLGTVHVGMSMSRLEELQQRMALQMLIIFILALAAGTVAAIFFGRWLLQPITQFIQRLKDIASRRGDLTQRLELGRNDEFSEMADYFNIFIKNIALIVRETVSLVSKMNVSLEEISSTAEQLSANADGVNSTVQGLTGDLEKQERESTATHNTIEDVLGTLVNIARKSQNAQQVSSQTENVSRQSGKTVQDSVSVIGSISDKMRLIEERMRRLTQSLSGIGSFVESIRKIASQTNLLSLNAAIEAARAGEAGRGFSVVAEEVRKLAEDSAAASEQIQNLISQIQNEIKGTGEATRQATDVVGRGSHMMDEAGKALSTIMESTESSAQVIEEISRNLTKQSDSLKEMIKRVENVKNLEKSNFIAAQSVAASVEEQTVSFEQITNAIQKLSEDAQNMRKLVVEFKIE
ncbi:MAG: methyl-accepting chemotaxis protein [candidate division FCPU426 bacterium]